jgi:HlyD family secretion protein
VAAIVPQGTTTSNVVTYSVLITVDPTDVQLLPSMTATVTIITEQDDNTILVPNAAISYAQQQGQGNSAANGNSAAASSVFVLRNGNPVRVPIQTGSSDGTDTVVLGGLQPGEQVVTGVSLGSSGKSSSSGGSNIFGFGGPGGGNNNRSGSQAQNGQRTGQTGQSGQGAQNRTAGAAGGAPAGGAPAGGPPPGP